jgi:hypothetical protein
MAGCPPGGHVMVRFMKRIEGFKKAKTPDEGWVSVKVKLRPAVLQALKREALRETAQTHRHVYVSDLLSDSIRLLLQARRIDPYAEAPRRFVPSDKSGA